MNIFRRELELIFKSMKKIMTVLLEKRITIKNLKKNVFKIKPQNKLLRKFKNYKRKIKSVGINDGFKFIYDCNRLIRYKENTKSSKRKLLHLKYYKQKLTPFVNFNCVLHKILEIIAELNKVLSFFFKDNKEIGSSLDCLKSYTKIK